MALLSCLRLWAILTVGLLLAGLSAAFAEETKPFSLERQGRCSPNDYARAVTRLARELSRRIDLDTFPARLREGLTSGHPDMPTFRFAREDARALTVYLRSVQGP